MTEPRGIWTWLERTNLLLTVGGAVFVAVSGAVGFLGYQFGQSRQAASLDRYIEGLAEQVPATQRGQVLPVIDVVKQAVRDAIEGKSGQPALARTAEELTSAVTSIPTGRYSIGAASMFSLKTGVAVLICNETHNISFSGPSSSYSPGYYVVSVDGMRGVYPPGGIHTAKDGTKITLLEASNTEAALYLRCGTAGSSGKP